MRQAVLRRKNDVNLRYLLPLLFLVAMSLSIFFTAAQKNTPEKPGAGELLQELLARALSLEAYSFTITENAGAYSLHFDGETRGREVFGTFKEHDLQVFAGEEACFVRTLPDGEWQDIGEAGLGALAMFVRSPLSVLNQLAENISLYAVESPSAAEETSEPLVFHVLADAENFNEESLLQEADTVSEISLEISFDRENLDLAQVVMELLIAGENGESHIRRTYTFSAETAGFPPDLPRPSPGEKV